MAKQFSVVSVFKKFQDFSVCFFIQTFPRIVRNKNVLMLAGAKMRCKSITGNESEQRSFSAQSVSTYSETDRKSEKQNFGPGCQQQRQSFNQMCMMLELDSPSCSH